jgi:DnaJ-class molecular chaperone
LGEISAIMDVGVRKPMEIGITELIIILIIIIYAYKNDRMDFRKGKSNFKEWTKKEASGNRQGIGQKAEEEQDPYKILNIGRNATRDEFTSAYRKLVKMYHPDMVAGLAPEYREIAERKMKNFNFAYRKLKETIER